jgi:hypothetical protein
MRFRVMSYLGRIEFLEHREYVELRSKIHCRSIEMIHDEYQHVSEPSSASRNNRYSVHALGKDNNSSLHSVKMLALVRSERTICSVLCHCHSKLPSVRPSSSFVDYHLMQRVSYSEAPSSIYLIFYLPPSSAIRFLAC